MYKFFAKSSIILLSSVYQKYIKFANTQIISFFFTDKKLKNSSTSIFVTDKSSTIKKKTKCFQILNSINADLPFFAWLVSQINQIDTKFYCITE